MKNIQNLFMLMFIVKVSYQTLQAQIPSYVPTNGLVGWWPFNGNALNQNGSDNNGIVNEAILTTDRFNKINSAYAFDGVNDYILMNNIPTSNSQYTISAWAKANSINQAVDGIAVQTGIKDGIRYGSFGIRGSNDGIKFIGVHRNNTGLLQAINNDSIQDLVWHHYVQTWNGTQVKLYYDGDLVITVDINTISVRRPEFTIGAMYGTDFANFFKGKIDDVGFWSRALTPEEIKSLSGISIPEINLKGNGITIADGDITPSATDHTDFGSQLVFSGNITRIFTIENIGSANLNLTGAPRVSISGVNAADFSVTMQPSSSVAASGSTTFTVSFDPSSIGIRTATITIANNDSDENPFNFSIQGTGTAPEMNVSGNSVPIIDGDITPSASDHTDFGNATVGFTSIKRTFSILNQGSAVLNLTGLTPFLNISGTHASEFSVSLIPSASIASSGSTTFQIAFNPAGTGVRSATISISNNDSDENPYNFNIQGTGLAPAPEINITGNGIAIIDGDNTPAATDHTDFGDVVVSGGSFIRTFTIQNTGYKILNITGCDLSGIDASEYTILSGPASAIGIGGSTNVQVNFTPSGFGLKKATLNISSDDADEALYNFDIQGTGTCNKPTLDPSMKAFSNYSPSGNSITVNWNRGNGDKVLVLAKLSSTKSVNPARGNAYTANATYGLGDTTGKDNFVVYNGTGNSVNVTGLTFNASYEFNIYEYNTNSFCYNTPGISSSVITNPALIDTLTYEGFNTGSYIIHMGVSPQTIANALKPYGLVYALLNANIPVKWVINPDKANDGIDFSHNGKNYSGGPFMIPAEFRTTAVDAIVNTWKAKGVVVDNVASFIILPVNRTLRVAPRWTIDQDNPQLVMPYWTNAEIPTSTYNLNAPSLLGACNDIFILPHADPTWAVHSNLYVWNQNHKGGIWYGCHAGSVFENTFNPAKTSQRMNFLMKDGTLPGNAAVSFFSHVDGTIPFKKQFPTEPVMQYLGSSDAAHLNGSEQIYLPTQGWRPTTKVGVLDPDHPNVTGIGRTQLSPGPAAVVAFGPGRGIETNGKVCAEGGHSLTGTAAANIAAQRIFWNFSFWAAADKGVFVINPQIPAGMTGNKTYALTANIAGGSGIYTNYQWTAGCGGNFSSPNSATTNFTPNNVTVETPCDITLRVTDNCGRVGFSTVSVTAFPNSNNLPPIAVDNSALTNINTAVSLNITDNDADPDGFIVPSSVDLDLFTPGQQTTNTLSGVGTFTINNLGVVTFIPAINYVGTANIGYTVQDNQGEVSNNAIISINVSSSNSNNGLVITCPQNTTISCKSASSPDVTGNAIATSSICSGNISISYTDNTYSGSCANSYTIERTWKASDLCGNTQTCMQIISVGDNVSPIWIDSAGSLDRIISCENTAALAAAQALAPVATDICSAVTYAKTSGVFVPGSCNGTGTYTNTWVAKDACSNTSEVFSQVITISCGTASPTGITAQSFCPGSMIADLSANGNSIKWYATSIGGTALSSTTILVNGTTYYASQTLNNCESINRLGVKVTINNSCPLIINLKMLIQGYYQNSGSANPMDNSGNGGCLYVTGLSPNPDDADLIFVTLVDESLRAVATRSGRLKTNGTLSVSFPDQTPVIIPGQPPPPKSPGVYPGDKYYIKITHRNSLETWSAMPVTLNSVTNYDFTTAANKAYGNNMAEVSPGVWALFSGDIADASLGLGYKDGVVETSDYSEIENAAYLVLTGYVYQDLTGDGVVETSDYSLMENNAYQVISVKRP